MSKYYVTTSIPYVNAKPHIGFALEALGADVLARYHRLLGEDVFFLTGTDEHGIKNYRTAKGLGKDTQEYVDEMSIYFRDLKEALNLTNDYFVRTTDERHVKAAQEVWRKLVAAGDIEKRSYLGYYCSGCEDFKTEKELINCECPTHPGKGIDKVEEENYFFLLSKYQDRLLDLFEKNPQFVAPETRYREAYEFLKAGVGDVSVSRLRSSVPWGVEVPDDPNQIMYVWVDALSNYISAIGYADDPVTFKKWWPADAQIIGKDIFRFHTLIWPAMLMSIGEELPRQIVVHGFITVDGRKMSKSLGNVIAPQDLIEKYGIDATRYLLLREIPFLGDGDFSWDRFDSRYNDDLANNLGNLINRTTSMISQYFGGKSPMAFEKPGDNPLPEVYEKYHQAFESKQFNVALEAVWGLLDWSNRFIEEMKPWELNKKGKTEELAATLDLVSETVHHIAVLLQPFMPEKSAFIFEALGTKGGAIPSRWSDDLWHNIPEGRKMKKSTPLFPRLV